MPAYSLTGNLAALFINKLIIHFETVAPLTKLISFLLGASFLRGYLRKSIYYLKGFMDYIKTDSFTTEHIFGINFVTPNLTYFIFLLFILGMRESYLKYLFLQDNFF